MTRRSPSWTGDGVPRCAYDDCPKYDGKRCEELGFRPGAVCEPAVLEMAEELVALRREKGTK